MFVWILLTGQTVAAVCVCVRASALSMSVVSVCAKGGQGEDREGGESGALFSAALGARGSSFTLCSCHNKQTM